MSAYTDALWRKSRALHRLRHLDERAAVAFELSNTDLDGTAEQLERHAQEIERLVAKATAAKTN